MLHDGYTDLLYVLLPVWQAEFGLSLAATGFLRSLYSGVMAVFQIPAGRLAERLGEGGVLVVGTALAGLGYLLAGWSGGFFGLALCLALGGLGSSVQHPLSSSLTARAYPGPGLRAALSTYNFSGDVGKMLFPAATAWLVASWHWRAATQFVGCAGLAAALLLAMLLRRPASGAAGEAPDHAAAAMPVLPPAVARRGFVALSLIGIIDSAGRMGFLTLLPFLLQAKGSSLTAIGTGLTLVFAGGATGKFVCGVIATRVGVLRTVILTEAATALGIAALLPLSLPASFVLLPFIGIALNGTSSVLYGTVAELAPAERRARAFGLFYTFTIGAGAVAPTIGGALGDALGLWPALIAIAATVLLVLPLTLPLRPALRGLAQR